MLYANSCDVGSIVANEVNGVTTEELSSLSGVAGNVMNQLSDIQQKKKRRS